MSRARIPVAAVALALAIGGGAIALITASDHVPDPTRHFVFGPLITWSFVGAGAVAWWRRPGHPFALLLMAAGFLSATGALVAAENAWIFTFGLLFANVATALYIQAIMAYPEGRLREPHDRAIVVAGYLLSTVGPLVQVLFTDTAVPCPETCPDNVMLVADRPHIAEWAGRETNWIGIALGLAAVYVLVRRYRQASRPRRRTVLPMLTASAVTALFFIAELVSAEVSRPTARDVSWGLTSSLSLVPLPSSSACCAPGWQGSRSGSCWCSSDGAWSQAGSATRSPVRSATGRWPSSTGWPPQAAGSTMPAPGWRSRRRAAAAPSPRSSWTAGGSQHSSTTRRCWRSRGCWTR